MVRVELGWEGLATELRIHHGARIRILLQLISYPFAETELDTEIQILGTARYTLKNFTRKRVRAWLTRKRWSKV